MFNLFKKKEGGIAATEKVWMTEAAKFQYIIEAWKKDNSLIYVFWFDDTLRSAESFAAKETIEPLPFFSVREINSHTAKDKKVIFAEHYPLAQKEKDLFAELNLEKVEIWSALDEPLFKHFGGDKIAQMMKQLGMKESEAVEHKMLSKAVHNAQEKIEAKVMIEQTAHSQKDWMEKNLPA